MDAFEPCKKFTWVQWYNSRLVIWGYSSRSHSATCCCTILPDIGDLLFVYIFHFSLEFVLKMSWSEIDVMSMKGDDDMAIEEHYEVLDGHSKIQFIVVGPDGQIPVSPVSPGTEKQERDHFTGPLLFTGNLGSGISRGGGGGGRGAGGRRRGDSGGAQETDQASTDNARGTGANARTAGTGKVCHANRKRNVVTPDNGP